MLISFSFFVSSLLDDITILRDRRLKVVEEKKQDLCLCENVFNVLLRHVAAIGIALGTYVL